MGSTQTEESFDRLKAEVFAMAEFISQAKASGNPPPWNVAVVFAEWDAATDADEECPRELWEKARRVFRAMPRSEQLRMMNNWSLPSFYVTREEAARLFAEAYELNRVLVMERSVAEASAGRVSAYHDFAFGYQVVSPVVLHIREGANKADVLAALLDMQHRLMHDWEALIDHTKLEMDGMAFPPDEDGTGAALEAGKVFDAAMNDERTEFEAALPAKAQALDDETASLRDPFDFMLARRKESGQPDSSFSRLQSLNQKTREAAELTPA